MNYPFAKACIGFFVGDRMDEFLTSNAGYAPVPTLDASGFAYALNSMVGLYDKAITDVQLNLLDSHDTARYLSIARGDLTALKLATLVQMTFPGAPCVYYGDEIGMLGGRDPDCRRAFPWDEGAWDTNTLAYFNKCIALRRQYRALRDGSFRVVYAEGKCVAYLREWDDEKLIVAINSGAAAATINIAVHSALQDGSTLQAEIGKRSSYAVTDGAVNGVVIPKRDGIVLRLAK
jgi:glycosidase